MYQRRKLYDQGWQNNEMEFTVKCALSYEYFYILRMQNLIHEEIKFKLNSPAV